MKIVFFGDSNTWGYEPNTGCRQSERFPRILARRHPDWEIVEEGQNGRTLSSPDPYSIERCGARQIQSVMASHKPYDLLVIMLGSNDAKRMFGLGPASFSRALNAFLSQVFDPGVFRGSPYEAGKVLLVQPPALHESALSNLDVACMFGLEGMETLLKTGPLYEQAAKIYGCEVLRTDGAHGGPVITGSAADGLHFQRPEHQLMAQLLEEKIESMLEKEKTEK